jgi:hypothetical protein
MSRPDLNDTLKADGADAVRKRLEGAKPYKRDANGKDAIASASLDEFYAYMPTHSFIFTPTREMWPASSVNASLPPQPLLKADGTPVLNDQGEPKMIPASAWLDQKRPVQQMTWAPGEPMIVRDRFISEGGWIERRRSAVFNLYRPPTLRHGDGNEAAPWIEHVHRVYRDEADHIIRWLAHRVQRPEVKINHALVLGGSQGIGKDTLLEPVKHAIGPWNMSEVSPQHVLGRFNGFLKSVILRVSEVRDLGDVDRFAFYEHMKAYTAAPPDVLRVDEKHLREYSVLNCTGVVYTTNHKTDGIYLPPDDRRHFVAWSPATKEEFEGGYWEKQWGWYRAGGIAHVAAYLAGLDISDFDPKAPPPKTQAFWDIVEAGRSPEDAELADVLDRMGNPDVTTLNHIRTHADGDFCIWLNERKNRRIVGHRLENCGYVPVSNLDARDRLWKINGARQVIYGKSDLSAQERMKAVKRLMERDI